MKILSDQRMSLHFSLMKPQDRKSGVSFEGHQMYIIGQLEFLEYIERIFTDAYVKNINNTDGSQGTG